jgi:hypothetical protein
VSLRCLLHRRHQNKDLQAKNKETVSLPSPRQSYVKVRDDSILFGVGRDPGLQSGLSTAWEESLLPYLTTVYQLCRLSSEFNDESE